MNCAKVRSVMKIVLSFRAWRHRSLQYWNASRLFKGERPPWKEGAGRDNDIIIKEANTAMCSVYEDTELYDWLRWADEHAPSFLRITAEAAFTADRKNYNLLRPDRLKLHDANPPPPRIAVLPVFGHQSIPPSQRADRVGLRAAVHCTERERSKHLKRSGLQKADRSTPANF
jgi:hypothetical protein